MASTGIITVVIVGVVSVLTYSIEPSYLTDKNNFFKEFFDHDFISFLAVLLTISIGLLAQLYVSVGKLKKQLDADATEDIRSELRNTVRWLLGIFFVSCALVAIKPSVVQIQLASALINTALSSMLVFYLLILTDVIIGIFDFDLDE